MTKIVSLSMVRSMNSIILATIENMKKLVDNEEIQKNINHVIRCIVNTVMMGSKVMICGNGGSAADSQHMAGELIGKFYKDRMPFSAMALTTDTSVLTSVSNDFSFKDVFSRQVRALGNRGDVLIGISTSGNSENVLEAFRVAVGKGIITVLLTGNNNGKICDIADIIINVPSEDTPRIQEMHLLIEHIICQKVEEQLCPNQ